MFLGGWGVCLCWLLVCGGVSTPPSLARFFWLFPLFLFCLVQVALSCRLVVNPFVSPTLAWTAVAATAMAVMKPRPCPGSHRYLRRIRWRWPRRRWWQRRRLPRTSFRNPTDENCDGGAATADPRCVWNNNFPTCLAGRDRRTPRDLPPPFSHILFERYPFTVHVP